MFLRLCGNLPTLPDTSEAYVFSQWLVSDYTSTNVCTGDL
jgi:hypothetical protein